MHLNTRHSAPLDNMTHFWTPSYSAPAGTCTWTPDTQLLLVTWLNIFLFSSCRCTNLPVKTVDDAFVSVGNRMVALFSSRYDNLTKRRYHWYYIYKLLWGILIIYIYKDKEDNVPAWILDGRAPRYPWVMLSSFPLHCRTALGLRSLWTRKDDILRCFSHRSIIQIVQKGSKAGYSLSVGTGFAISSIL